MTDEEQEGWTRFNYSAQDGMKLAARLYGWENRGPLPVICLAGLTRNSADFHELATYLAHKAPVRRRVFCPDYRGRGMSAWDENWENYNPLVETGDVLAGAAAAGIGEAVVVGTSRGGMIAMIISALRPGLMRGAVLNDVGPEIEGRGLVRIRNYVEKGRDFPSWRQAVEALRQTGESQFPRYSQDDWEKQAKLIFEQKKGSVVRRYDPRLTRTLASINLDNPLPAMWAQFSGLRAIPVLAIRGERSDLLTEETLEKMRAAHPGMRSITVADQGHAPDLGQPELAERIAAFVARVEAKEPEARALARR